MCIVKIKSVVKLLEPGDIIKPLIPDETVPKLVRQLYGLNVETWKELDSYDDKNYHVIDGKETNNPHVNEVWEHGYVLKILNTKDSKCPVLVVKNKDDYRVVTEIIESFSNKVMAQFDKLQKGIIHGDITEQNLLVYEVEGQTIPKEERVSDVSGILDFSDVSNSYIVFDLAICICYMSIECKLIDVLDVGGHVLAGYFSCAELNSADKDVLHTCVAARLTQSLVMGLYSKIMDPSNTYVLTTGKSGWPVLHKYWNVKKEELYKRWWNIVDAMDEQCVNDPTNDEKNAVKLLEPDEITIPLIPDETVPELVRQLYGLTVEQWKELNSYVDKNYHVMVNKETNNPHVNEVWEHGYVLKILNTKDSECPTLVEASRDHGICTQEPVLNIKGNAMSLERIFASADGTEERYGDYIIRLLKYIPGKIMYDVPYVPQTFYNIGKFVGQMHQAMKGFYHPIYDTFTSIWSLSQIPKLSQFTFVVKNKDDYRVVTEIIESFSNKVMPQFDKLQKGIIHGDISEQNLLVHEVEGQTVPKEERVSDVSGMLDFAHVSNSYIVFDLAICICYMSIECKLIDVLDVGGHVLAGYFSRAELNSVDKDVLHTCVAARLTQSLVMGLYSYCMDPRNTYVLTTGKSGWPVLHKYWNVKKEELYRRWWNIVDSYK
ncbi:hypothetical protein KUTeg_005316 [Tegillarca granosa]|uniref:Hydroxylysine kinase n=1 Tax=Tegillarca granosa TaxID=220873 RepID=A0ABQ9FNA4_TEGGR|nr:hypothetical protein KUTeg_005316 [Tegillarca granosa]